MNLAETRQLDIAARLERWGRWARDPRRQGEGGVPTHSGTAASQLGPMIDRRAEENGEAPPSYSRVVGDSSEEQATERAVVRTAPTFRKLLKAYYVEKRDIRAIRRMSGAVSEDHARCLLRMAAGSVADLLAKESRRKSGLVA